MRCRESDVFIRDMCVEGSNLGRHAIRIAVKEADTNHRVVKVLAEAIGTQ